MDTDKQIQAHPLLQERHLLCLEFSILQAEFFVGDDQFGTRLRMKEIFVEQCALDKGLLELIPESCAVAFIYH